MTATDDDEEVKQANQGFYRAFESLNIDNMRGAWATGDVTCVHPGWPLLKGVERVMDSWKRIFENTAMMQFTITGAVVRVEGGSAWVMCTENINTLVDGKVAEAKVQATNVFMKIEGRWLVVHHHGSPLGVTS